MNTSNVRKGPTSHAFSNAHTLKVCNFVAICMIEMKHSFYRRSYCTGNEALLLNCKEDMGWNLRHSQLHCNFLKMAMLLRHTQQQVRLNKIQEEEAP